MSRKKNSFVHLVKVFRKKLAVHVPVGVVVGDPLVLHEAGEALVQPEVVPPGQCHQISEPSENQNFSVNKIGKTSLFEKFHDSNNTWKCMVKAEHA